MSSKRSIGLLAATTSLGLLVAGVAYAAPTQTGPNSSQSPYLLPVVDGATATSLLTVGDSVGGYRMVGIPDGMGTFDNGDGTFTVLMNHEISNVQGVVRDHGAIGSFVSKWTVDKSTLAVTAGDDLIKKVMVGDGATGTFTETPAVAFSRFCSADLAALSAFYNAATGKGTQNKIFMNGEETGVEGRGVAHVVTGADAGTSYVLPWLGKMSWENALASPNTGDKTVLVNTDDSTPGQVYVYIGDKRSTGNDVEKAGLVGGKLYGVKVAGIGATPTNETDATTVPAGGAAFTLVEIPDAATSTGAAIETISDGLDVTEFARPEDASWDPTNPKAIYLATTASFTGISRLWKLEFTDLANPLAGGTAKIATQSPVYDAANVQGPRMMDNITTTANGHVLLQEDPGGNEYLSGIFEYDPVAGTTTRVFRHDPVRYSTGAPAFKTIDEESSGIIPAPFLGSNVYLADVQSHNALADPELVQDGQLLVLKLGVTSGVAAAAGDIVSGQAGLVNVSTTSPTAAGTVEILNGTTVLGTGTVTNGKASVALAPNSLPVGTHTLTVKHLGDGSNAPSSSTFPVKVVAAAPTPTVTATPSPTATATPVTSGTTVTLDPMTVKVRKDEALATVKVTGNNAAAKGIVSVLVDGVASAAGELVNGAITLNLGTQSSVGTKNVTATYYGDASTKASTSSPVTLTVTKQKARIKLSSPVKASGVWKLPVTVKGQTLTPKGAVKVKIGKQTVKAELNGGTAFVTLKGVNAGAYKAVVKYTGSALIDAAKKATKFRVVS